MNLYRFELARRAQQVIRFHTAPTNRLQTVGEHSFGVCIILMEFYDGEDIPLELIKAALYHDVAEADTGDIPSPALRRFPSLRSSVKIAEESIAFDNAMLTNLTDDQERQLKLADRLELALFAIEDYNRGNKRAERLLERVLYYIRADELVQQEREASVYEYVLKEARTILGEA